MYGLQERSISVGFLQYVSRVIEIALEYIKLLGYREICSLKYV